MGDKQIIIAASIWQADILSASALSEHQKIRLRQNLDTKALSKSHLADHVLTEGACVILILCEKPTYAKYLQFELEIVWLLYNFGKKQDGNVHSLASIKHFNTGLDCKKF